MGDNAVVEDSSLSNLPEYTNVRELLAAIEEQLGRQVRDQIEDALDRDPNEMINVRELLTDIQNELGGSYFDTLLQDEEGESGITSQDSPRARREMKGSSTIIGAFVGVILCAALDLVFICWH